MTRNDLSIERGAMYAGIFREAADLAEKMSLRMCYVSAISSIWISQAHSGYLGCVDAESKFRAIYHDCVAENSAHAILMLLMAAEFCDG